MANIINGKAVAAVINEKITIEMAKLKKNCFKVGLAFIVSNDFASKIYVKNKKKACEYVGFNSYEYDLDENTTQDQLLNLVNKLNRDDRINGILVQLPLLKHIDEKTIINSISPDKDVDAFHPVNVGRIMIGEYLFMPCTPAGVIQLIESTGVDIKGKQCVVIGRSNIVGKPMAMLLLQKNGTVTICHSKTKNLKKICLSADIIVVSIGKSKFLTGDMIKEGAVVIDVGINKNENGKICGDVDFESAKKKASWITPVPGGVGPMTIAMLMQNTLIAAKKQAGIE